MEAQSHFRVLETAMNIRGKLHRLAPLLKCSIPVIPVIAMSVLGQLVTYPNLASSMRDS